MRAGMTEQDKKTDGDDPIEATDSTEATEPAATPRTKSARAAKRRESSSEDSAKADVVAEPAAIDTAKSDTAKSDSGKGGSKPRQVSLTFTARGVFTVLAALLAIAAVVGVCLLGWGYYQQREKLAAYDDSKAASANFAVKMISSFNTDEVGDMKEVLGPLTTGAFHERLAKEQSEGTKALKDLNVKATPTVKSVGVESFDTDSARTNVLVNVTGSSSLSPSGGQQMTLLWMDLRKVDGKWLVAEVDGAQADVGQSAADVKQQAQQNQPVPAPAPAPAG